MAPLGSSVAEGTWQRSHLRRADPNVSICWNYGYLCIDGSCSDWPWVEPVVVKGEMARPGVEQTHVTMQSIKDNDSGLSNRQQCLGGHAQSIHEGGVSFSTAGGGSLYFPFGYVGQYGQANGQYQYDTCNLIGG